MSTQPKPVNRLALAGVVLLCVVSCVLIFLLPGDSLVVDLVYRGF